MVVAELDVGEALVIAQHDVEAWLVRLDEVVFQQQRLGLRVRDRDLNGGELLHQRLHLRVDVARGKIGADPVLKTARLADVEQFLLGPVHAVHPGALGQRGEELLVIEGGGHAGPSQAPASAAGTGSPASSQARASTERNMAPVRRRVWVL